MRINYKRELEEAARNMILVHKPQTLIRMILRMIILRVKVDHAGILLFDKTLNSYVLTFTRGQARVKMPAGLIRLDLCSPIIKFFIQKEHPPFFNGGALTLEQINRFLKKKEVLAGNEDLEKLLLAVKSQMINFEALVCLPSYYRESLLAILVLGRKIDKKAFGEEEVDFFMALANDVAMALRNAFLFEDLEAQVARNKKIFLETTMALSAAIDAKDHYTQGHTRRVTEYALAVGRAAALAKGEKIDEKFLENIEIAGLLHDIGKIGVPESILNKNGALTAEEYEKIKEHAFIGAAILEPIKDLAEVILGVKYHHERYDGTGYPQGLKGDEIPLIAAIIAVADSFDAMITDRPYRRAMTPQEGLSELARCSGTQFHPRLVSVVIALCSEVFAGRIVSQKNVALGNVFG